MGGGEREGGRGDRGWNTFLYLYKGIVNNKHSPLSFLSDLLPAHSLSLSLSLGCYFRAMDFEGERNTLGKQARGPSAAGRLAISLPLSPMHFDLTYLDHKNPAAQTDTLTNSRKKIHSYVEQLKYTIVSARVFSLKILIIFMMPSLFCTFNKH